MDIHQQLEQIIEKEDFEGMFSFLEKLSKEDKKALQKTINKLYEYYNESIILSENKVRMPDGNISISKSYGRRGSKEHMEILNATMFVCQGLKDFEKAFWVSIPRDSLERIFQFYVPDWLGAYVEKSRKDQWRIPFGMDYDWMMDWVHRGLIPVVEELIISLLPHVPFQFIENTQPMRWKRVDENLLKYPETLNEHIWLFFERESNIHMSTGNMFLSKEDEAEVSWIAAFKSLSDQGKIDRQRLLKASLSALSIGANKNLTSWFFDVFVAMEPTTKEMLSLQPEMLNAFNNPFSKPQTTTLKYFKKLCLEDGFQINNFLEYTPILLASETKTIVNNTLMILDKLAKKYKDRTTEFCEEAAQAFIHSDSAIQIRAAKLILKYGDPQNEFLVAEISNYQDELASEPREILAEYLTDNQSGDLEGFDEEFEIIETISPENEISLPETIHDLFFLASESFDNNSPYHIDLLPAALLSMNGQITAENVAGFQPTLHRAFKIITGDLRTGQGLLDHMLANFFISYSKILITRFPEGAKSLRETWNQFVSADKKRMRELGGADYRQIYPFREWRDYHDNPIYHPFKHKLLDTLHFANENISLPLLSTPTHHAFWIAPDVLIHRIHQWQEAGKKYSHTDFQIAISRLWLQDSDKEVLASVSKLKGEPKRLLTFLLNKNARPQKPYETIAHWWTAGITKNPKMDFEEFEDFVWAENDKSKFSGELPVKIAEEEYEATRWDYKTRKQIPYQAFRKEVFIEEPGKEALGSFFSKIFRRVQSPKSGQERVIYEDIRIKGQRYEAYDADITRFFSFIPNQPEVLLFQVIDQSLRMPDSFTEGTKRMLIRILEQLFEHPLPLGKMGHLLLAGSMICSDKTARNLAAETWMNHVSKDSINSEQIGRFIGQHFYIDFAPVKRLTDLITESMLRISSKHDVALQILIEHILMNMNDEPVRGLKKLLEVYQEVRSRTKKSVDARLEVRFEVWRKTKGLVKVLTHP